MIGTTGTATFWAFDPTAATYVGGWPTITGLLDARVMQSLRHVGWWWWSWDHASWSDSVTGLRAKKFGPNVGAIDGEGEKSKGTDGACVFEPQFLIFLLVQCGRLLWPCSLIEKKKETTMLRTWFWRWIDFPVVWGKFSGKKKGMFWSNGQLLPAPTLGCISMLSKYFSSCPFHSFAIYGQKSSFQESKFHNVLSNFLM